MKSILLSTIIAIATVAAIFATRKDSAQVPDYTEQCRELHSADPNVRQAAVLKLTTEGNAIAIRTLLTVAREEEDRIRVSIFRGLGNVRDPEALKWLTTDGLTFPDRWTRYYAVQGLYMQLGPGALPVLLPHLARNYWQVQYAILEIVDQANAARGAVEALGQIVNPEQPRQVRELAILLLGRANSAAAARALIERALPAADKPRRGQTELEVENALSSMKDAEAQAYVADLIATAPNEARRQLAIRVAGRARIASALPKLKALVADATIATPTRVAALRAAVQAGGEEGVQVALGLLEAPEPAMRLEAAYALGEEVLGEAALATVKARREKEADWRVKQALGLLLAPK